MAAPNLPGWQQQILSKVGAPATPENVRYLNAWAQAEGGGASNNPFNTTEGGHGATGSYNSVGVENYGSPQGGVQATADTLLNGKYGNILSALKSGRSAMADAQALAASPWGTGSLVEKVLGGPVTGGVPTASGTSANGHGTPDVNAGGTMSRAQLANLVFGHDGINFGSNQIQAPNLMALAQARASALQAGDASMAPSVGNGPPTSWKGGSPVADLTSTGAEHATEGLAGYPAHDFFAPAGSPATAPITGKVVRLSGHDPSMGPIDGPHGPLGWSVYIQGRDGHTYYLTHMGSRSVAVGQVVRAGQPIGTVANYAKYGTPSHIHMGVH